MKLIEFLPLQYRADEEATKRFHELGDWYVVQNGDVVSNCKWCGRQAIIKAKGTIEGLAVTVACPNEDDHEPNLKRR